MNDYEKIAKAIDYIRDNVENQPGLEELANQVHLSPFHFQRLFSRWAGVSPKRFLQVLTLDNAKRLIKKNDFSVMDVSDEIGLSSGSRLYDHFVQLEAVTPSQYKQAGAGLSIYYACHETPYGQAFIAITSRGICQLVFVDSPTISTQLDVLKQAWPKAELIEDQEQTADTIQALFYTPTLASSPLSLLVRGTNFQIKVWQALLKIQPGCTSTYGEIAQSIGQPKAARAVGTAIGANPVAFIIPCHRVILQSGELGGYRWGQTRKHAMLARESAMSL